MKDIFLKCAYIAALVVFVLSFCVFSSIATAGDHSPVANTIFVCSILAAIISAAVMTYLYENR